ncbi:TRAP transporter small permease subunit [candidate division KSB3 bacterium]|uniref:TRAP transporter small permease subunit n=1 Tax=candidate division KSB3 bacterium TaxID=2044937 RepID=A0A9D5Q528_9BACT|nr:TRAP transporter small permease subunit [candidate division KSB3 bacterium]MBD3324374.1 TRAP transporter small permease subunit [candidate division KSB3 bacterium]
MKFLRWYIKVIDQINEKIGYVVSWLTTVMVVIVCYDVFTRYVLKKSSVAVQELEWHLFAMIFLLGAAWTLKEDKHVRVDVLYTRLSRKQQAWVNLFGSLVFLLPFALLVVWTSVNFVKNSYMMGESSPNPGGLPARYILKACIPAGFLLLFFEAITLICKSILIIVGKADDKEIAP